MSTYQRQKKYIYASRRKKRALKYIEKLNKIIEESSIRNLKKLLTPIDDLGWKIREKLGWFDGIDFKHEFRERTLDKKIRTGESLLSNPVAHYICRVCHKTGYLFSPDLCKSNIDLYFIHLFWNEKEKEVGVKTCHLGKTKRNFIIVLDSPNAGVLTLQGKQ